MEAPRLRLAQSEPDTLAPLAFPSSTIGDALDAWIPYLSSKGRPTDGLRRYRAFVEDLFTARGWALVSDMTLAGVEEWLTGWRSKSHNNRLHAVRNFAKFAAKRGREWCARDLLKEIELATDTPGDGMRDFTMAEQDRIIAGVSGTYRHALYLVYRSTGVRKSNLCLNPKLPHEALQWGWVIPERGTLRWPAGAMKAKKAHEVPIPADAMTAIQELREPHQKPTDPVFPFWVDNRVLHSDMARVGIPREDARGRRAAFNSFRKCYATSAVSATDIRTAQSLTGHATPKVLLANYAQAHDGPRRAAVEKIFTPANAHPAGVSDPSDKILVKSPREGVAETGSECTMYSASGKTVSDSTMNTTLPQHDNERPAHAAAVGSQQSCQTSGGIQRCGAVPLAAVGGEEEAARFRGESSMRLSGVEPPRGFTPRGDDNRLRLESLLHLSVSLRRLTPGRRA